MTDHPEPRLYHEFAAWWPLLSRPEDYAEEAAFYERQLRAACDRPPTTLLELGSGGGNNASYLKRSFDVVLVDRSPEMLAVSRVLNPECEHHAGDMRSIRLDRLFDLVFVHDAIGYMLTQVDLRAALETAFLHMRPGGAALFAPDHLIETFRPSTSHGGHDGPVRAMRYLEWTWDPDPTDSTYQVDYAYLLRDEHGAVEVATDRHIEGLFARAEWLGLLADVGFEARAVPFDHSELEPGSYEIFIAKRAG